MEQDIHKLAAWMEKVAREGVAIERKILEWKLAEKVDRVDRPAPRRKVG